MFKHRRTGIIFNTRKDAVILMGESRYRKFLSQGEFEFPEKPEKDDNI